MKLCNYLKITQIFFSFFFIIIIIITEMIYFKYSALKKQKTLILIKKINTEIWNLLTPLQNKSIGYKILCILN